MIISETPLPREVSVELLGGRERSTRQKSRPRRVTVRAFAPESAPVLAGGTSRVIRFGSTSTVNGMGQVFPPVVMIIKVWKL
ncbi:MULTISPECIES: hypothetical protein [unclassified Kitasatospora]|uniref:hypothetical protein n=1 Tax=unclassified Kitasatospora TaxID=2633591 RepID=UPI0033EFCE00